ncbi:class I SAM-dependent methyltransferase [Yunchengibacter salinarum]|uniref:class I SAM-dependent methyltransferase n=1 Tax=Yunchengibacter salinarum TaxID=3133399 RepID=UPI0035B67527
MSRADDPRWMWEDYWQSGHLACCLADDLRAGYDGPLASHWRSVFQDMPDGARILDLATGNGGVAMIAADVAAMTGRHFTVTGVDLARIDPARHAPQCRDRLAAITFQGGVDVTDLPMPDASVDLVVSQFGVEYAPLDRALDQALRVLAPGGRLHCVLHAGNGRAEQAAERDLALLDTITRMPLHANLRRALDAVTTLRRDGGAACQAAADEAVHAFIESLEALNGLLAHYPNHGTIMTLGRKLMALFEAQESEPPASLMPKIDASEKALTALAARLSMLRDAALSADDMRTVKARLEGHGCHVSARPLLHPEGGDTLAWTLNALPAG